MAAMILFVIYRFAWADNKDSSSRSYWIGLIVMVYLPLFLLNFYRPSFWYLSHIFAVLLPASIAIAWQRSDRKISTLLACFGMVWMLCQMEPHRNSNFKVSFLRVSLVNELLSYPLFQAATITVGMFIFMQREVARYRSGMVRLLEVKLRVAVAFLGWLNHTLSFCWNDHFYEIRMTILLVALAWLALHRLRPCFDIESSLPLVLAVLASLFLGRLGPFLVAGMLALEHLTSLLPGYPLLLSLLGEAVWWWIGSRREYAEINPAESFVFSEQYFLPLNAFTLAVSLICPQLFLYLLMLHRIQTESTRQTEPSTDAPDTEEKDTLSDSLEQQDLKPKEEYKFIESLARCKQTVVSSCETLDYVWLWVVQLLSAAISLHLNNQTQVYALFYVPLFILSAIKGVSLMLVLLLSLTSLPKSANFM